MSKFDVTIDGQTFTVELDARSPNGESFTAVVNGQTVRVTVPEPHKPVEAMEWIIIDNRPYELVFDPDMDWIKAYSGIHRLGIRDLEAVVARPRSGDGRVKAPIPGLITRLLVRVGDLVEVGQPLLVLEAMKMENEIRAPRSGQIAALHVQPGQSVLRNDVLTDISGPGGSD